LPEITFNLIWPTDRFASRDKFKLLARIVEKNLAVECAFRAAGKKRRAEGHPIEFATHQCSLHPRLTHTSFGHLKHCIPHSNFLPSLVSRICGCCSAEINFLRYRVKDTPSCRANFLRELSKHGLDSRSLVPNINFFMHIPFNANAEFEIKAPLSRPGDRVDLAAEMDCLAVISNCPQILNPARVRFDPEEFRLDLLSLVNE
jgi:hypothetical protein